MIEARQAMRTIWRVVLASTFLVAGVIVAPPEPASAAAVMKSQAPCGTGSGPCFNFGVGIVGLGQFSLRTYSFKAPSQGSAEVVFHGSLLCSADSSSYKVVDLVTQITNASSATASASEPGGMRQAMVLEPSTSDTFNLTSTRVVTYKAAGAQTFNFMVRPLRIDSGANCYVYNAAFSVVFIP